MRAFGWIVLLALACAACATPAPSESGPRTETVFVVIRGWHTDITVAADGLDPRLAPLRATFPGARFFVFGIGERTFLFKEQPGLIDMLTALLPNPTAMLVTALNASPDIAFAEATSVIPLRVTAAGLIRLNEFIASSVEYGADGAPRLLAEGPYPGSLFYYATPQYSGLFTCNTWAAEALRTGGLPIRSAGVVFATGVADQARRAAE